VSFTEPDIYYFNSVQSFVRKYKLARVFRSIRGIPVSRFEYPIEDVVLIRKLMPYKFGDRLWSVTYVPELQKVMVTLF